ncbi:histone-like nucleoid-structuring protein Lsr2 [Nonomuraea candida]|uniref:histone-like nucleoid-structuring protein Lsr2 n=1 Tax=Nonomuraea candida TaxID=359159 RepID=UPI0005BCEEC5|nr:Lsr2 family protein [Nonomuraea candida]
MARRLIETITDDFDGSPMEAENPVSFSIKGDRFIMDLTPENEDRLRAALAPFIAKARRDGAPPVTRSRARRAAGGATRAMSKEKNQEIRQWAKAHGLPVSERGRIAATVIQQYDAAHEKAGERPVV